MYWNGLIQSGLSAVSTDKLQHEMYWNALGADYSAVQYLINYNMRCIETTVKLLIACTAKVINYNMRCIETKKSRTTDPEDDWINYNMRCIETLAAAILALKGLG